MVSEIIIPLDFADRTYANMPMPDTFYSTESKPQPHRDIYSVAPVNLQQRSDASQEREYSVSVGFSGKGSISVLRRKGEQKSEFTPNCKRQAEPYATDYRYIDMDGNTRVTRIVIKPDIVPPSYLVKSFNPSQVQSYLSDLCVRARYARQLVREDMVPVRRVATGLTAQGKKKIADCIALLEYKYGKGLGFYTLTCPYTNRDDIQEFNNCYSLVFARTMEELKREYARADVTFSYVAVHEIQPGRYKKTGNQCLHVHFVAPCFNSSGGYVVSHAKLGDIYERVLRGIVGRRLDCRPRVECSLVRSSAAGYLAKYYSKGNLPSDDTDSTGATATLSSWYSISRNLLHARKRATITLPEAFGQSLYRAYLENYQPPNVSWFAPVYKVIDGRERLVGFSFEVEKERMSVYREIVFPQVEHLY